MIYAMRQKAIADNLTICYHKKKQIDVSLSWVCPVIDNELRLNIVKVICRSTWLSPRGSIATSTLLWRTSWSITGCMKDWCQFVNWSRIIPLKTALMSPNQHTKPTRTLACTYLQTSSPSSASYSSIVEYDTRPPITEPIIYTSHVRRPKEQQRKWY